MNYYISRDGQQFGPYTLADLQRYVASGNILVTDLTRSEGMADWVPVSQVIGNIPVPVATAPAAGGFGSAYPNPPNLHWAIVLLLTPVTCFLFPAIWAFVEASWARRVMPQSKCLIYFIIAFCSSFVSGLMSVNKDLVAFTGLLNLAGIVLWLVGVFSLKSAIEEHYNSAEPIGLSLSGVMTFFFGVFYFQYHFSRINQLKRSGQLTMAQGV
jgi:GYF domain 2